MKCIHCGVSNSVENPVTFDVNPFEEEVNHNNSKDWECDKCREQSAQDI